MALLTSSSRRFARSNRYSHEQRHQRVAQVRERIDLVAPARRPEAHAAHPRLDA